MLVRIIVFLVINFGILGLGAWMMGEGPTGEWYMQMNKAPWTPPGWVFGAAWTTIMIGLSIYMAILWEKAENRQWLLSVYAVQLLFNLAWNPAFFYFHQIAIALGIIIILTVLVGYILFFYMKQMKYGTILIAPYFIWLIIATSLNAYALLHN